MGIYICIYACKSKQYTDCLDGILLGQMMQYDWLSDEFLVDMELDEVEAAWERMAAQTGHRAGWIDAFERDLAAIEDERRARARRLRGMLPEHTPIWNQYFRLL
eukprot:6177431-Pleurochrysis_carterae.AAC.1